jgi:hypothetical protein
MDSTWRRQYGYILPLDGNIPTLSDVQKHFERMAATNGCDLDYVVKKTTPYTVSFTGVCTTI